jgi:heme A synthase
MHGRLQRFAWWVLGYNIAVVLWGAYVRATGSGAGCGSHWPLCNGVVVPRGAGTATLIEFSHRLTSGLALLGVLALLIWVWRAFGRGHPARRGALWSLLLILVEAGIGAGLVLFELVADNASMARALFMAAHLVNTFFLLAALTLTAVWIADPSPMRFRQRRRVTLAVVACVLWLIAAGMSGAVAALGDTLYPSETLADALRADLSPTSHFLLRLRVLHPALAIGAGLLVMLFALRFAGSDEERRLRRTVMVLVPMQLVAGFVNVLLLAPVWLQLVHLLLADAIWIGFVMLGVEVMRQPLTRRVAAGSGLPAIEPRSSQASGS